MNYYFENSFLRLRVISPARVLLEAEVLEVQLPGLDGFLGIWPGHRPLNTCLRKGEIHYRTTGHQEGSLPVSGGLARVENDIILVFTDMEHDD